MTSLLVIYTTLILALIQHSALLCHAFLSTHHQQRRANISLFRSHNYGKPVIAGTKTTTILHSLEENQEIPVITFRLGSDDDNYDESCVIIDGELDKDSIMETVMQSQGVHREFNIRKPSEWRFMVKKKHQSFYQLRWDQFRSLKVDQLTRLQNVDKDYLVVVEEKKALRKVYKAKLEDPILPSTNTIIATPNPAVAANQEKRAEVKRADVLLPNMVNTTPTPAATTPATTTITPAAATNGDPIVDTLTAADHAVSGIDLAHAMGVASQSTDYDFEMVASQAIRGNLHSPRGFEGPGTYAHTKSGRRAWWRVDFNTPITVAYFRVYGRPGYGKRLQSVTVRLLRGIKGKYQVVKQVLVLNPSCSETFAIHFPTPVEGINRCELHKPFPQLGGDNDTLNLNAVQIFDEE